MLDLNASTPIAAFELPVIVKFAALLPTKTLEPCGYPPKLCMNGEFPTVIIPPVEEVVLSSARIDRLALCDEKSPDPSRRTIALNVFVDTAFDTTVFVI